MEPAVRPAGLADVSSQQISTTNLAGPPLAGPQSLYDQDDDPFATLDEPI